MAQFSETLSEQEKIARFQLIRTENIGPIIFRQLIEKYTSAEKALEIIPELAKRGGRKKPFVIFPISKILAEIEQLNKLGGTLIVLGDKAYPNLLSEIEDAPPVLMALGNIHLFENQNFAIVGARSASAVGLKLATRFSQELGNNGYVISSGLARGIDAAAHKGALKSGTIAVVAGGVNNIYPHENNDIYHQIKECGLIISEMPLGTEPQARHFPRRNRIISGLASGVLIVEATDRSGTLITARLALEQGREVFAIPGSPLDPRSKGPNNLIKQGAMLTESVSDILETLALIHGRMITKTSGPIIQNHISDDIHNCDLIKEKKIIKEKLSHTALSIDDLIRLSELSPGVVQTILLEFELAGEITRHAGNRVSFC